MCGDVYTGPKFAIDAITAGHEADVSIHRFVRNAILTMGRNPRGYRELNKDDVDFGSHDTASRQVLRVKYAGAVSATAAVSATSAAASVASATVANGATAPAFREYVETFSEEQVKLETARCLGCGASVVDENKCIDCGLCTTKCALTREIKIRFGKKKGSK